MALGVCQDPVQIQSLLQDQWLSGQCLPQSLTGAGKKRIVNSYSLTDSPPSNTPRAALQEKLVGDVLSKNTQIQLAWRSLDRLSHHH